MSGPRPSLPDGEYPLDLSNLFKSDSISDIFGIRYSFRPDNMDNTYPSQLIKLTSEGTGDSNTFIVKSETKSSDINEREANDNKDEPKVNQMFFEGKKHTLGIGRNLTPNSPIHRSLSSNNSGNSGSALPSEITDLPSVAISSLGLAAEHSNHSAQSEFVLIYDEIQKKFKLELFGSNIVKVTKSRTPLESNVKFNKNLKALKALPTKEFQSLSTAQLLESRPPLYNSLNINDGSGSLPNSAHNSPLLSPTRMNSASMSQQLRKKRLSSSSNSPSPLLKSINSPIFKPTSSTPSSPISAILKSVPVMKKASSTTIRGHKRASSAVTTSSTLKRSSDQTDDLVVSKRKAFSTKNDATNKKTFTKSQTKARSASGPAAANVGSTQSKRGEEPKKVVNSTMAKQRTEIINFSGDNNNDDDEDEDADVELLEFANELEQEWDEKEREKEKLKEANTKKELEDTGKVPATEIKIEQVKSEEGNSATVEDDDWDVNYSDWDEGDFENCDANNENDDIIHEEDSPIPKEVTPPVDKALNAPTPVVKHTPSLPMSMKALASESETSIGRVNTPTLNGEVYSPVVGSPAPAPAPAAKRATSKAKASKSSVSKIPKVSGKRPPKTPKLTEPVTENKTNNTKDIEENDDDDDDGFGDFDEEDFDNALGDYDFENSDLEGEDKSKPNDDEEEMSEEE